MSLTHRCLRLAIETPLPWQLIMAFVRLRFRPFQPELLAIPGASRASGIRNDRIRLDCWDAGGAGASGSDRLWASLELRILCLRFFQDGDVG